MTPATATLPPERPVFDRVRRLFGSQEAVLFLALIRNLSSIFLGNAYIAVAAIGMSMVIISGNIDISVGSLIGVLATISGTLAVEGYGIVTAWVVPIICSVVFTSITGALVAYLRMPAIVVTLGMLSILKGGLISVTDGAWINNLPEGYGLAQLKPLGIPMPIYFMVVLTILAALWMRYTAAGRAIYAVGGNPEAARLSGISRERTIMMVFAVHGVFTGIAAVLFATQFQTIQSTVPPNLELIIITASVVGGVSILGGTGTVIGSTLAAILLAAIGSALIFIDVSAYWLRAVQGVLILLTVLADLERRRRQRKAL
jgi:ribose/xylose/arabinose/galactoside ABC-type transport system permease subunit